MKTFTTSASAILALSSIAAAAPMTSNTSEELSLTAKLQLADTTVDRYNLLSDSDFTYNFNTSTSTFADRKSFPVLEGTGMAMTTATFPPCAWGVLHLHPRATEMLVLNSGHLKTEMVPEGLIFNPDGTPRVIRADLLPNAMTVFPAGSFHTQWNPYCEPASGVAAFNNEDPGVAGVVTQTFSVDDLILAKEFGGALGDAGSDELAAVRQAVFQNMITEVEGCRATCGLE